MLVSRRRERPSTVVSSSMLSSGSRLLLSTHPLERLSVSAVSPARSWGSIDTYIESARLLASLTVCALDGTLIGVLC